MGAPGLLFLSLHTETLKSPDNVPFIAARRRVRAGEKEARRAWFAPSCLVHFRWPGPCATSIIERLIELTFRPAPSTPGLPVLCQPLTITPVSHRLGRSENQRRDSTQAEAGDGGVTLEGREEGLLGGSWGPSFQSRSGFPNERKSREWCPLSPCHTGTFKKPPQWFLKWGVFSRDKKREREEKNEWAKNLMVVLCEGTGSGRMATLVFVRSRGQFGCISLAPWNLRRDASSLLLLR